MIRAENMEGKVKLGDSERDLLYKINNGGLLKGALAGVASLVLLRRIRATLLRKLVQERDQAFAQANQGSHVGTNLHPHSSPSTTPHVQNSPFATGVNAIPPPSSSYSSKLDEYVLKRSKPFSFINIFGWALDCTVAFSIASFASIAFTDRKKVLNTVVSIPLVPGTSTISDELCPTLLVEMQRLKQEDRAAKELLDRPQTAPLMAFAEFAKNCQMRQSYERQARRQLGLSANEAVVIPQPGLPEAFQVSGYTWNDEDSELESTPPDDVEEGYDADAHSEEKFFDQGTWTDDFAADQDESTGSSK